MSIPEATACVVVADDDADVLFAVCELLRSHGYQVLEAGDAATALEHVGRGDVDVVLSDIAMPDMDGIELLRRVRERDLDLPVVLMTGQPRVETAVQAVDFGALRYLLKPVAGAALAEAIGNAVRLRRLALWKREALLYTGAADGLVGDPAGLESSFGQALESLWMAFQPIVRSVDHSVYGYEALARSEAVALPRPSALFGAAERLSAVHTLGRVIRERAASNRPTEPSGSSLFVNLHAADLNDEELYSPDTPLAALAPSVVLEITERASLWSVPDVEKRVKVLREMGFRIAIDDLGAGYAGLTSFAALQPEVVKLDMSIVQGVDRDPIKRKLVGSVTALCRELEILVVAEGVEQPEERDLLTELGCDLLQGYLFGQPSSRG
jgi:EAL domain-containing protein (putative c-di-GMP-specific phosphodiesterase class I)